MRRLLLTLVVLAVVGGSGYAYYRFRQVPPKVSVTTAAVTRGDVVDSVGATGTLQAVTTVQVGTQVSGTILSLYADFNSLVRKGQVLARLDPSLFQTQIEQARANLLRAQADLERLKVSVDDAQTKLARARELSGRSLIPKNELDTAEVNLRSAQAQVRSSEAQVTQARASVNQNDVNLQHTVIEAPIDGLVISRSVDVGQTVAASMQAPTLFVLAADLTKMQVIANLDESDVGRIRPGQHVRFRVDAYPAEDFVGTLSQVRLEPKVQQNVVTYATVIDVPNNELKLKPGMTANVNIDIARSTNVVRIPNSALRFRPTNEMYAAIGQPPPDPAARAEGGGALRGGGMRRGGADPTAPPLALAPQAAAVPADAARPEATSTTAPRGTAAAGAATPPTPADGRGGARGGGAGRGAAPDGDPGAADRFAARMQNMTPEQRAQFLERRRERGLDPSQTEGGPSRAAGAPSRTEAGSSRGRGGAPPATPAAAPVPAAPAPARSAGATTIDALFGPLPKVESVGRVWLYVDKQLKPVRVRIGISDGQSTELLEGDVQQGAELVTNISTSQEARPAATAGNPFIVQPGRGGFGGGGFGGGGRGGAGGGAAAGRGGR